ncbi:FluG family protein [Aspergillus sclerotioniger CBS 115572]|uniref:FluG family protein n=1 Tax=Aspergillus sclerotioniger CBS 115572 TaxID=1450535 RepID=A0A317VMZ1_9EURO|nr:FluG family protein [Aspergillus sclerotioniger CBS 115572]PWY75295.1 FluG family protein [Aspergillus sclerotioniger CBS 115572]
MMESTALSEWQQLYANHQGIDFVWVSFTTYIGTNLVRIVPMPAFHRLVERNQGISVPRVILHILPYDNVADGGTLTGSLFLQPDLRSFSPFMNSNKATVMASWTNHQGQPLNECPRSKLESLTHSIEEKSQCSLLIGFELEFTLLRQRTLPDGLMQYETINRDHSWCSMTRDDELLLTLLEEATLALQQSGIMVQQFHAELGPGQWEFVLPPISPLKAVDTLLLARQILMKVANKHGYRATLHPRLSPGQAGTGAHVHISLNSETADSDLSMVESFFAGILDHFTAISAFTLPQEISYDRVVGGIGSGGDYVCWGWENKETILRRVSRERFEVKMMDGLANPYLGVCAVFAAGLDGLRRGSVLTAGPCTVEPYKMSGQEREALGIKAKMPGELAESLKYLEADEGLKSILGDALVSTYLDVKTCEMKVVRQMTSEEKRTWFITKY